MAFIIKKQSSESRMSSADTKKASILICKVYILMQNLEPLLNDVCLTMELFYVDKVTPPDCRYPCLEWPAWIVI